MLRKHTQNQQNLQRNSGKDSDRIHSAPNVLISAENYSSKSDEYSKKTTAKRTGIKSRPFYYRLRLSSLFYAEPLPATVTAGTAMSPISFTVNQ